LRKFFYYVKKGWNKGEKDSLRYHLYIQAEPRFSQKEMYAKQHRVHSRLDELPFNREIEVKSGSSREGRTAVMILLEPNSSAFHYDFTLVKKVTKILEVSYDNVLEFVFMEEKHIEPFLDFVMKLWGGKWLEHEP